MGSCLCPNKEKTGSDLFTFLHYVDPQIRKKTVFKVSFMCPAFFGSAARLLKTSAYRLVRVMNLRCLVAGFLQKKLGLRTSKLRRWSRG